MILWLICFYFKKNTSTFCCNYKPFSQPLQLHSNLKANNMKATFRILILCLSLVMCIQVNAQDDNLVRHQDSLNNIALKDYQKKLKESEKLHLADSIKRAELEVRLNSLKSTDNKDKEDLKQQLQGIADRESERINQKKARIDSLRLNTKGYPVIGLLKDTLFNIYAKIGATTAHDRALNISKRISNLYHDDYLKVDSISTNNSENTVDIVYGETIIMSISENDALWNNENIQTLANDYNSKIKNALLKAKKENSLTNILMRVGFIILILSGLWILIWLFGKAYNRMLKFVDIKKDLWLKNLSYREYIFLTSEQEYNAVLFILKWFKWFVFALTVYLTLPLLFSIFPFTRGWANGLFNLVWIPLKGVFVSVWNYLPNLFVILVIYFVMRYFIRFVHYIFNEIESENLKISSFHPDWAMPTFSIIRFLLYAFMFILIFPKLPGSDSDIFKGVSVFVGVLFSLGSSSAIGNMVAGLVITYMRPFKIGDRIKVGEVTGDVVEKTLLVTRLQTIKNEEITIPNAAILSGNITNYSSHSKKEGLIIHTTVTIGYDVPWKDMHQALIDAALKTDFILQDPKPFILQTSLDDFYVSYQLNAYTSEANKQALIYSNLHQNIQDVCNERGIEIMSPHYRAQRDGNRAAMPNDYLGDDYQTPNFKVEIKTKKL